MINWPILQRFVASMNEILPEDDEAGSRSQELTALSELASCNVAITPALCFFAGRLVEVSVSGEWTNYLVRSGLPKSIQHSSLDERINHLLQLGVLDSRTAACIHEIRKLGNKVRHQALFPSNEQAAFCLAMLKVALPWMAGDRREQAQEVCAVHDVTVLDPEVCWLLNVATLTNPTVGMTELLGRVPHLLYTLIRAEPTFPTEVTNWATQQCIDAKRFDLAGELIAPFLLNRDPDKPQLIPDRESTWRVSHFSRLVALRLSRMSEPNAAIAILTPLAQQAGYLTKDCHPISLRSSNSHAYAETLGILAGAYKTLWIERLDRAELARFTLLYRQALAAEPWNSYLAINAAACAAWSGDLTTAQAVCAKLLEQFVPGCLESEEKGVNSPWIVLTHAEALLLNGQYGQAIERYRLAYSMFGITHPGDIQRAYTQVDIHTQHDLLDGATRALIAQALGVVASSGT
jgi:hypothetical protein